MYANDWTDPSWDPTQSTQAPAPTTKSGFGNQLYDQIGGFFKDATGGRFTPTLQDVSQWGTNVDPNYLNTIRNHIYNTWAPTWNSANPAATTTTTPTATTGGGGGGGGSVDPSLGPMMQPFTGGMPSVPDANFMQNGWQDFNFTPYHQPTLDELNNDPANAGYQFTRDQGLQALGNSAAAKGLTRSGGTMKDFINYGMGAANQYYGQANDRSMNTWSANLAPQMANWQAKNAAGQRQSELDWQRGFDTWGRNFDIYKYNQQWPYTVLSDQQHIGLSAALG